VSFPFTSKNIYNRAGWGGRGAFFLIVSEDTRTGILATDFFGGKRDPLKCRELYEFLPLPCIHADSLGESSHIN